MEKIFSCLFISFFISVGAISQNASTAGNSEENQKDKISGMILNWHAAAGDANFDAYFSYIAPDGIFIGTDPTENWVKPEFEKWAKPYFESGKTWDFKTLKRNVFLSEDANFAWFDELLETHMGICRGSGVVRKIDGEWKVQHYVLSISIPNEDVDEVTGMKKDFDKKLIDQLKSE